MYGVIHMDASGEDNPPVESLSDLYDELYSSGIKDGDVSVTHDDSGWSMSAYRNGGVVFGQLGKPSTDRHMESVPKERVLELWRRLIDGDIEGLLSEPWKPGYMDPAERAAQLARAAEVAERSRMFCVSVPDYFGTANLFRLNDGRFQIIQPGHMPMLIDGPDHILVREELAGLLSQLSLEGVRFIPAVIYDRAAGQERSDYRELLLTREITFDDINQLDVHGMQMWRLCMANTQYVFVSLELKDRLLSEGFTMLEFLPGLSRFGGLYGT